MQFPAIRGPYPSLQSFIDQLDRIPRRQQTLLIGIDGCGGSGKSTAARLLAGARPDITIIHMDDFYLTDRFDWERLREQVLAPLTRNESAAYQMYDWPTGRITDEWHAVPAGGIVVIEGVMATRRELRERYDFRIWVECPRELRLARGIERDGEAARERWEHEWMVAEDRYMAGHDPKASAHLVLDGAR